MANKYTVKVVNTTVQQGGPFEKSTIVETRRVFWYDDATGQPLAIGISLPYGLKEVLAQSSPQVVPVMNGAYPGPVTGTSVWEENALLRSLSAVPTNGGYGIDVTCTYDTLYFYGPGIKKNMAGTVSDATANKAFLPARASISTSTKEINVWRVNWSTQPPKASNTTSDIGGTAVVSGITPIKIQVPTAKIKVRLLIDAEINNITAASQFIGTFAGKRNSDTFLGYPAGELVCTSGVITHLEGEFFEVSTEYTWDAYYEHVQVPEMAADGRPKGGPAGPTTVKWQRPDRTAAAFNDLFGATEQGGVWRYMCEEGTYYA